MANREKIFMITKGRCFYCGCQLDIDTFHMDHYFAKANGGREKKNFVPSCSDCNIYKSDLSLEAFRMKLQGLTKFNFHGRLIAKYYGLEPKEIKFFFEEVEDGDIQNNIHQLLDGQQGG